MAQAGMCSWNGAIFRLLTVKFRGGDSELVVDPGVPVTRIDVVDKGAVKSGARVRVPGVRNADGATANQITLQ
jgi:hypothetical protein